MKRLLCCLILLCTLCVLLAGCQEKAECDFCGKEDYCTTRTMWGEEAKLCRECNEEWEKLFD